MSKNWKNWVILTFHYLDFLHDATATATQNGFRTHLLAAPLLQLQQCEHSHWIQCNPFVTAKKKKKKNAAAPCERTLTLTMRAQVPSSHPGVYPVCSHPLSGRWSICVWCRARLRGPAWTLACACHRSGNVWKNHLNIHIAVYQIGKSLN